MEIQYQSQFVRQYKKIPEHVKDRFEKIEHIFRVNPFDTRLKTHKLKGALSGLYSFSLTDSYRVLFGIFPNNVIRFYQIGTHNIYRL